MMAFHTAAQLLGNAHSYLFNIICNKIDQTLLTECHISPAPKTQHPISPSPQQYYLHSLILQTVDLVHSFSFFIAFQ